MKYAAIFMCMFASTAVAGITKGKLDNVDTTAKTISVDGETFHYDENTKNRTKDWKPKQGDTIVLSWFNEVDDDFEDIKLVKSFRRDYIKDIPIKVRDVPDDVRVVDNPVPLAQAHMDMPAQNQEAVYEELKNWSMAEALKSKYVGKKVVMYVYDMKLSNTWVNKLPWVTVEHHHSLLGVTTTSVSKALADKWAGVHFLDRSGNLCQFGFVHVDSGFVETIASTPRTKPVQVFEIRGTIMELNSNGWIGLSIHSLKPISVLDVPDADNSDGYFKE